MGVLDADEQALLKSVAAAARGDPRPEARVLLVDIHKLARAHAAAAARQNPNFTQNLLSVIARTNRLFKGIALSIESFAATRVLLKNKCPGCGAPLRGKDTAEMDMREDANVCVGCGYTSPRLVFTHNYLDEKSGVTDINPTNLSLFKSYDSAQRWNTQLKQRAQSTPVPALDGAETPLARRLHLAQITQKYERWRGRSLSSAERGLLIVRMLQMKTVGDVARALELPPSRTTSSSAAHDGGGGTPVAAARERPAAAH